MKKDKIINNIIIKGINGDDRQITYLFYNFRIISDTLKMGDTEITQ